MATTLTVLAVALSLAAAAIHLAAAPGHIEELGLLGWGFVLAAAFQAGWPLAYAVRPSVGVGLVGVAVNSALIGAWAWSRTVGLPVGSLAGRPEPVAVPDLATVVFELLLVALLLARAARLDEWIIRSARRAPALAAVASVPAVGIIFLAAALGVSLAMSHAHSLAGEHGHPEEAAVHGHP